MIVIYDNDKPITAAERIITATKEPETLAQIVTDRENGARQQYNTRELLEIANYLLAYVDMHKHEYIAAKFAAITDSDDSNDSD